MHLKAIAIKERLLAPEDYEVALSVGHLASLYNYDMQKFDDAEKLYKRSVAIGEFVPDLFRFHPIRHTGVFLVEVSLVESTFCGYVVTLFNQLVFIL